MQKPAQQLSIAYAQWVIRWRWPVLICCLLLAIGAGLGMGRLKATADYRVYFGEDNPQLKAFETLEDTYTKTDNIFFVLQPSDKDVFTRETLAVVKELTEAAWKIPSAIRVDSITNFQHTEAVGDDLTVGDLVEDPEGLSDARLAKVRKIALNEPSLAARLISADARTTGVAVTLQFSGGDNTEQLPLSVAYGERLQADLRAAHPDMIVALTGMAPMSSAEMRITLSDMQTLSPAMLGIIAVIMLALLRSLSGAAVTFLVVSLSTVFAMGMMGWIGLMLNAASSITPIIILTLSIADSVHILMSAFHEMREGRSKHDALVESLRINTEPVFLTTLTTAIGFLSLNFSDSPPFRDLGNMAALGVMTAWALSMTFLPALMSMLPVRIAPRAEGDRPMMVRLGDFVVTKRRPLLWGSIAFSFIVMAFIPRMEIDDRFVKWFDESIPFRSETDFATANLVGPYLLDFSIGAGESGGISEPVYLERLDAFAQWLRGQPSITHVNSYTDVIKRVNQSLHGDDPDWRKLPASRELAAQYLLLYEMSLPYGLDLNSQVNVDKSATRMTVTLDTIPTNQMRDIAARAERWLKANAPPAMWAEATGVSLMFAYLTERNIRGMLIGTALAFLLIAGILIMALHSLRLGLISLVSNFFPVLIAFGLWSIFVGHMGIIASIITATSLGLIVDDTVHILSKYNRARRERRLSPEDAVRFSFSRVGYALLTTTVILVAGFSVLAFSDFQVNVSLGLLTALTLSAALALDFLLLPPLLMLFDKDLE